MLEFVDTNIVLYAFDNTSRKQGQAQSLLSALWGANSGCLSIQVLQESYVNLSRKLGLSPAEALEVLRSFSAWRVFSPTAEDVFEAVLLQQASRISFWDAMIVLAASRLGCATLWSEDLNAGQTMLGVTVRNPFDP